MTRIALAYSTDADDAFMFWALDPRAPRVDTEGLEFTHHRADTQALNLAARAGRYDVTALSLGAYADVAAAYRLLDSGASVGRGYGPVVVARRPLALADLAGVRVGIPGEGTTAYKLLVMAAGRLQTQVVPIHPFAAAFEALERGAIDAALLIHEGRLTYAAHGLHLVLDLGVWWQSETGLPLVLGVNVIRRALGDAQIARVARVLDRAMDHALAHREEAIDALAAEGRARGLDRRLIDTYLGLYANEDTRRLDADGRRAVALFLERAAAAGLSPAAPPLDFVGASPPSPRVDDRRAPPL